MPSNQTAKQEKNLTVKSPAGSNRKAPGTRIGTLFDWREGSVKSVSQRHGCTIRDGR
jgi:hypothetical protein